MPCCGTEDESDKELDRHGGSVALTIMPVSLGTIISVMGHWRKSSMTTVTFHVPNRIWHAISISFKLESLQLS
jgi:hypothetical protein